VPHDPRTGYYGHQLSPLDQQQQVRPDDNTSSARGRRRRALGDDGTGGTRVIDLLSKHGKAPGPSTGSHRRHAEPPAPNEANGSSANGSHGTNGSSANGSHSANGGINGQSYPRLVPPPAERSRPGVPPAEPRQERQAPPPQAPPRPDVTRPAVSRPRLPRVVPPPSADPRPAPPPAAPPAPPPGPPAAEPRPSAPPAAASWTPPGTQRGLRPVPPERRGEPRRPGETPSGRWPRPAPPRPNGFAVRGGVAAASGAAIRQPDVSEPDATRIAEALSGKPAAPPEAPQRGGRRPESPPPARPGRPAAVPPTQDQQGPQRPAAEAKAPAETRNSAVESPPSEADWDLDDDGADWSDDQEGNSDEVKAIDATLARFSAVHDQIAEEEAARRKRYSWLLGKRKEPELGKDMPFDFVEGRDAQASRLEWKKKRHKRRVKRILMVVVIIAVLAAAAVLALRWLT
jgi:hypothetical protein